jgi:hypothetical protein
MHASTKKVILSFMFDNLHETCKEYEFIKASVTCGECVTSGNGFFMHLRNITMAQ